jgi:outer membrane protein W
MRKSQKGAVRKIVTKSFFIIVFAIFALLAAGSPALSDTAGLALGKNYVVVKGGIFTPGSTDMKGFSTGFNGEVGYGRYLNDNFALELGVGYFQTNNSTTIGASSGDDYMSGNAKLDLWVVPLTATVKAIYPIQQFEIYALGGIGAYFVNYKLEYDVNAKIGGKTTTASGSPSSNTATFGGYAGVGANYNFPNHWYVGAEGKYLWTRPSIGFEGNDVSVNLYGWIVTGQVGYKF